MREAKRLPYGVISVVFHIIVVVGPVTTPLPFCNMQEADHIRPCGYMPRFTL